MKVTKLNKKQGTKIEVARIERNVTNLNLKRAKNLNKVEKTNSKISVFLSIKINKTASIKAKP